MLRVFEKNVGYTLILNRILLSLWDYLIFYLKKPDVQYYDEGVDFSNFGQYAKALASFNKALAINCNYAEAWFKGGVTRINLGSHSQALVALDKALAINPNDADVWYNRGNAPGHLKRYSDAIASYEKALAIDPDNIEIQRAKVDTMRREILVGLGAKNPY
jgi:tetratricopeptide (TPR) repeat protein